MGDDKLRDNVRTAAIYLNVRRVGSSGYELIDQVKFNGIDERTTWCIFPIDAPHHQDEKSVLTGANFPSLTCSAKT